MHHWWAERVTSIALVPLTLWFIYATWQLVGVPYERMAAWAANPVNTALLLALVFMTFHHMHLGLQVVAEDYVAHKWTMTLMILGFKAISLVLGLMASVAVLKLALS